MAKQKIKLSKIRANIGQIEGLKKNPRVIKDAKLALLVKSLQETPELLEHRGLLVYPYDEGKKYVTIGGNQRLAAAKEAGFTEIWCEVLDEATSVEKLNEYIIKDNASFGEWDFDMLGEDWNIDELTDWGLDMPDLDKDEIDDLQEVEPEAAPEDPYSKEGDIWHLGAHKLICGDSTKAETFEALMGGEKASLIVTDPPYNVALGMNETPAEAKKRNRRTDGLVVQNDSMPDANFKQFLVGAFKAMSEHLRKGGGFYIWHADSEGLNFRIALKDTDLELKQNIVWAKNSIVMGRQDYQWQHEPCLYGWKKGASHYFIDDRTNSTVFEDKVDINKLTKEQMKNLLKEVFSDKMSTTVIHEDKPLRNAEHPTMKPIKLIGRLVRNSSKREQLVLDPFGGSGSTLITCEQLGRRCNTIELDPKYVDVIVNRYIALTGDTNIRLTRDGETRIVEDFGIL